MPASNKKSASHEKIQGQCPADSRGHIHLPALRRGRREALHGEEGSGPRGADGDAERLHPENQGQQEREETD